MGPRGCILRPALFEEQSSADAPLLLSLSFLLHCKATLCLDEQRGLWLVSQHLGFSVPCHLGPTGALRIPIQQFTSDMISFLSQRIPKTSDEYELLQTHHVGGHLDEHEHAGSVSSSQFEKTPARGASPCVPLNHAWHASEARPNRGGQSSHSLGLAAPGPEDHHDHEQGQLPQGPHEPQDAWPSRFDGPTDPGDGRDPGRQAAGEGDVGPHRGMAQSRSHETAEHFQVSDAFRLVSGDRDGTSKDTDKTYQNGDISICPDSSDTGKSSSQHVGHPEGPRREQGDTSVLMQPTLQLFFCSHTSHRLI